MPHPSQWKREESFLRFTTNTTINFSGIKQIISGIEIERFRKEARQNRTDNGICRDYSDGILIYCRDHLGREHINPVDPENSELEL